MVGVKLGLAGTDWSVSETRHNGTSQRIGRIRQQVFMTLEKSPWVRMKVGPLVGVGVIVASEVTGRKKGETTDVIADCGSTHGVPKLAAVPDFGLPGRSGRKREKDAVDSTNTVREPFVLQKVALDLGLLHCIRPSNVSVGQGFKGINTAPGVVVDGSCAHSKDKGNSVYGHALNAESKEGHLELDDDLLETRLLIVLLKYGVA